MTDSLFVEDGELVYYINNSYRELYDIITTSFHDYNIAPPLPFILSGGANTFLLPEDFYKLRGVDYTVDAGGSFSTLYPFEFNRRNRTGYQGLQFNRTYRLVGNQIFITPEQQADGQYRIWYVPKPAKLVDDTDTINEYSGWDEYVITDAAIKCKLKQEDDVSALMARKEALRVRIEGASRNRDAGSPGCISDVSVQFNDENWEY